MKPKKKSRWKVLSGKDADLLEQHYRHYTESSPVDFSILDLENGYQVRIHTGTLEMCDLFITKNTADSKPYRKKVIL